MADFFGAAAFICFLLSIPTYFIWKYRKDNTYTADEKGFLQAGILILYAARTITIGDKTYGVDDVKGIRLERGSNVVIEVDDFDKPVHKISFWLVPTAEKLQQRICTALRKAGGPSFA